MGVLLIRPIPIDYAKTVDGTAATSSAPAVTAAAPQTVSVYVTAYASVPQETDATPFVTASNKRVADGFLAANFLPFGTQVQIPALFGDKVFTVEDRMNRKMIGFVDVWMPTVAQAKDFGIHKTDIVVVSGPGSHIAER